MFIIEDDFHAEHLPGKYATLPEAAAALNALARVPWGEGLNLPPCKTGPDCTRTYVIIEYDPRTVPWRTVQTLPGFNISAEGITWRLRPECRI
jgi:hypothetical protein